MGNPCWFQVRQLDTKKNLNIAFGAERVKEIKAIAEYNGLNLLFTDGQSLGWFICIELRGRQAV